ncbi:IS1182 family transposase [Alkalicella caledoniensis]|uniref:IS1182 family transposase n=1 Tax=Alkalicella caledoniensis TaxID=2731377 RepID=A0A7G9W995_ALKCA|nr:IS1182 family transposase [Alkalicella caledoniensis]QNO15257.1 IS1182 family transposase [Alkalicella caledoniensis]
MSFIQGTDRKQKTMFPDCIEDYIGEDNPVRVIDEYVKLVNMSAFTKSKEHRRGAPGYHPSVLLKLYLYGYVNGIRSSRKLETESHRNIEVVWLLQKLKPDFKTIADFRKENKTQLKQVFKDFTKLCKDLKLLGEEFIAIDGTKIQANNSKKNNFSKKKIQRHKQYIEDKVNSYLDLLESSDKDDSPKLKYTPEEIQKKIEKLKERKIKFEELEKKLQDSECNEVSTVDEDARLMDNKNNGVTVAYNIQTAVDSKHSIIVAYDVTNNPADQGNLNSLAEKAKDIFGKRKLEVAADKGYYQADDLMKCERNETTVYLPKQSYSNATGDKDFYGDKFTYVPEKDLYICPLGHELRRINHKSKEPKRIKYRNYDACKNCESKSKCTTAAKGRIINRSPNQDFLDTIDARTEANMDKYLQRQMIVEHPYGTIKRTMNAGYFLTRGMDSVTTETALVLLAYNFKRVINIIGVKELLRILVALRPTLSLYFYMFKSYCTKRQEIYG